MVTEYGSPPDHTVGQYFPYPKFGHPLPQKDYPASSFSPGSLIPAVLKYPSSLADSHEENEQHAIGGLSDDDIGSVGFFKLDEDESSSVGSVSCSVSSQPQRSIFGDYEEVKDEDWDVVSDEGSWEDEIFDDSDICTINVTVHYGPKR